MKYKVELQRSEYRTINITAESESDAKAKALIAIDDPEADFYDYDGTGEFVCSIKEISDENNETSKRSQTDERWSSETDS